MGISISVLHTKDDMAIIIQKVQGRVWKIYLKIIAREKKTIREEMEGLFNITPWVPIMLIISSSNPCVLESLFLTFLLWPLIKFLRICLRLTCIQFPLRINHAKTVFPQSYTINYSLYQLISISIIIYSNMSYLKQNKTLKPK